MLELSSFFQNKMKLDSHKKVCKNKWFCSVIIPPKTNKVLEFN